MESEVLLQWTYYKRWLCRGCVRKQFVFNHIGGTPLSPGNAYIMVPPKNTTVNENNRVKLTCAAEGYPNNITYRWYKNDVDVQQVPGLMTRAGIYNDGSFVISSVLKEDTGWYRCSPSNGLGPPPEAEAFLNITCEFTFRLFSIFPHNISFWIFQNIVFFLYFNSSKFEVSDSVAFNPSHFLCLTVCQVSGPAQQSSPCHAYIVG